MKTKTMPQDLEKFTQVKLLDGIISAMKKKKLSEASITAALPYIQTFARRINVSDDAVINIYNRGGKLVASLTGEEVAGGRAEWRGRMKNGNLVAPLRFPATSTAWLSR